MTSDDDEDEQVGLNQDSNSGSEIIKKSKKKKHKRGEDSKKSKSVIFHYYNYINKYIFISLNIYKKSKHSSPQKSGSYKSREYISSSDDDKKFSSDYYCSY